MTLKDVARLANVSTSTVSRIINSKDNSFASEAVRNRVWEIIKSTGYVPNVTARNLRLRDITEHTRASNSIACIFARVKKTIDNPFFTQIARAVEQQALAMGYVMTYSFTAFDIENIAILDKIMTGPVDGMVVLGRFDVATTRFLKKYTNNFVYVGLNGIDFDCDQVLCDGYEAALSAMDYLVNQGHKTIAYLGETKHEVRYKAYIHALEKAGIPIESRLAINCESSSNGGYNGIQQLLDTNPTPPSAIFCINDITAIAAMKRLREAGLKIPQDVSVISIDDIEMAQYVAPMLTTVGIPKTELGAMAAKILIDRIEKGHKLPTKIHLPHKLVIRESVTKYKPSLKVNIKKGESNMSYFGNVNWEQIKARHTAFWKGELTESCLIAAYAPRDGAIRGSFPRPTNNKQDCIKWWLDPEQVIARFRDDAQATYYGGDAFPLLNCNLGPVCHAGYFKGSQPQFESSIWFDHTLEDYDDLEFDPHSFMYKTAIANAKAFVEDAKGDYVIGMPDISGAADALSHLRGADKLLMDFMDQPDKVKQGIDKVLGVWEIAINAMQDILSKGNFGGGSIAWLHTWAPGFLGQLQCDCSVMLSPDMFEEFLLHELMVQSSKLEQCLYHLDGEEQVRHLPYLLQVPNLHVIQWTNVISRRPVTAFIPVLQQIQAAGKGILTGCSPKELPILLENLDASNLYLRVWVRNQEEADAVVKLAKHQSRFKK